MRRTLIIAYGNPLRGDDAVGWHIAARLREQLADAGVEILCVQQLTPEVAEEVSGADRVIFVDAAAEGSAGEIRERLVEGGEERRAFTHHSTPEGLVAAARGLYGRAGEAWVITVTGAEFSCSTELSAAVDRAVAEAVEVVLRRVSAGDRSL